MLVVANCHVRCRDLDFYPLEEVDILGYTAMISHSIQLCMELINSCRRVKVLNKSSTQSVPARSLIIISGFPSMVPVLSGVSQHRSNIVSPVVPRN